jgi:hypothetical protein
MLTTILAAIPAPPIHDVTSKTADTVFNIFLFVPLAGCLGLAIRQIVQGKGPELLYCILGGALCALFEPIVDTLGLCFLKERGAVETYTILGRTMPLWIIFVYAWFNGGLGYLCYRLFQRGISTPKLFALWAIIGLVDIGDETPGILLHTYLYYGKQPLDIWGLPLWWIFVNPVMPILAGALIYATKPKLSGYQLAAIIAFVPMADGIANAATAFPVWMTLNQPHSSYLWTYLASFITLGLSLLGVWLISLAVARPAPELANETLLQTLAAGIREPRLAPESALT